MVVQRRGTHGCMDRVAEGTLPGRRALEEHVSLEPQFWSLYHEQVIAQPQQVSQS